MKKQMRHFFVFGGIGQALKALRTGAIAVMSFTSQKQSPKSALTALEFARLIIAIAARKIGFKGKT